MVAVAGIAFDASAAIVTNGNNHIIDDGTTNVIYASSYTVPGILRVGSNTTWNVLRVAPGASLDVTLNTEIGQGAASHNNHLMVEGSATFNSQVNVGGNGTSNRLTLANGSVTTFKANIVMPVSTSKGYNVLDIQGGATVNVQGNLTVGSASSATNDCLILRAGQDLSIPSKWLYIGKYAALKLDGGTVAVNDFYLINGGRIEISGYYTNNTPLLSANSLNASGLDWNGVLAAFAAAVPAGGGVTLANPGGSARGANAILYTPPPYDWYFVGGSPNVITNALGWKFEVATNAANMALTVVLCTGAPSAIAPLDFRGTVSHGYSIVNFGTGGGLGSGIFEGGAASNSKDKMDSLALPDSARDVRDFAFKTCGMTNVNFGAGVTNLGAFAFEKCRSLTGALLIPASVETIGEKAFWDVNVITGLEFGADSALRIIGDWAFASASFQITDLVIPKSVETIGEGAFNSVTTLENLTFEAGSRLATIGAEAFGVTGITALEIPQSVTTIGDYAFSYCFSLAAITFEAGSLLAHIGVEAFACTGAAELDLPDSVEFIGDKAFTDGAFERISTPSTYTLFGDGVFADNASLTNVTFRGSHPVYTYDLNDFYYGSCNPDLVTYVYHQHEENDIGNSPWCHVVTPRDGLDSLGTATWMGYPIVCIGHPDDSGGGGFQWLDVGAIGVTLGGDVTLTWDVLQITNAVLRGSVSGVEPWKYVIVATDSLTNKFSAWVEFVETNMPSGFISRGAVNAPDSANLDKTDFIGEGLNPDVMFFKVKAVR